MDVWNITQNESLSLNIPSTECRTFFRVSRSLGRLGWTTLNATSLAPRAILSIMAMGTRPVLTDIFADMVYDCSTHSSQWYLNFISIPSIVCPKFTCIELLISLPNDQHLFADGFVTKGQSPWNLGDVKKTHQVWGLANFTWIGQILPKQINYDVKLYLKTYAHRL